MPSLAGEASRLPDEARARFTLGIQEMQALIARSLQSMGHAQPQSLASSAQAELIGAMALARAIQDDAVAEQLLADSRSQLKRRLGLNGDAHG
jgi:TetR/AcrR family transcriptional repressor of nem operon